MSTETRILLVEDEPRTAETRRECAGRIGGSGYAFVEDEG